MDEPEMMDTRNLVNEAKDLAVAIDQLIQAFPGRKRGIMVVAALRLVRNYGIKHSKLDLRDVASVEQGIDILNMMAAGTMPSPEGPPS